MHIENPLLKKSGFFLFRNVESPLGFARGASLGSARGASLGSARGAGKLRRSGITIAPEGRHGHRLVL
jgi:hypothetical protein